MAPRVYGTVRQQVRAAAWWSAAPSIWADGQLGHGDLAFSCCS